MIAKVGAIIAIQNEENLWADFLGHFPESSDILTDSSGRQIPETHLGLDSLSVFV